MSSERDDDPLAAVPVEPATGNGHRMPVRRSTEAELARIVEASLAEVTHMAAPPPAEVTDAPRPIPPEPAKAEATAETPDAFIADAIVFLQMRPDRDELLERIRKGISRPDAARSEEQAVQSNGQAKAD